MSTIADLKTTIAEFSAKIKAYVDDAISDIQQSSSGNIGNLNQAISDLSDEVDTKLDADASAVSAAKLDVARSITFSGDVTASFTFDGSSNKTVSVTVNDSTHSDDADRLGGVLAANYVRTDVSNTLAGALTLNNKLYFEDQKHSINYNDGSGNFNIKVGVSADADLLCTEDGYGLHTTFNQTTGDYDIKISDASELSGSAYSFNKVMSISPNGNVNVLGSLSEGGVLLSTKYAAASDLATPVPAAAVFTDTVYTHPTYSVANLNTSGATIIDSITTNSTGHITAMGTRVLSLADIGAAASNHNHDGDYAALSHTHSGYASTSHSHSNYVPKTLPAGTQWIVKVNNDADTGMRFNSSNGCIEMLKDGVVKFRFDLDDGNFSNTGDWQVGELL